MSLSFLHESFLKMSILLVKRKRWKGWSPVRHHGSWGLDSCLSPPLRFEADISTLCGINICSQDSQGENVMTLPLPQRFVFCWKLILILLAILKVTKNVLKVHFQCICSTQCFVVQDWHEFPWYFTKVKAMEFFRAVAYYFIIPDLSEDSILFGRFPENL